MKTLFLLATITSITAFSQANTLEGKWTTSTTEENSVTYLFSDEGKLTITESGPMQNSSSEANYYYEEGSQLMVVIKWNGDQAETQKFHFIQNDEHLMMEQFYPIHQEIKLERSTTLAEK